MRNRDRRLARLVPSAAFLFALAGPGPAAIAAPPPCDSAATTIVNGGFETPSVGANDIAFVNAADLARWQTTAAGDDVEIWGDGFLGVPAFEGTTFTELNVHAPTTLYQDVATTPGSTLDWSLRHRGRDGVDAMQVLLGDAMVADPFGPAGWDAISPDIASDRFDWAAASGSYAVPDGQTCTRIAFRSVSTLNDEPGVGNLLDAIELTVTLPEPDPTPTPAPTPTPTPSGEPEPILAPGPDLSPPPTDSDSMATTRLAGGSLGWLVTVGLVAAVVTLGAARRSALRSR